MVLGFNVQSYIWSLFKAKKIIVRRWSLPNYFPSNTQSILRRCFFLAAGNKKFQWANATAIAYDANEYPPNYWLKTVWAQDSQTCTWLVASVSRVCSKTMPSPFCITSQMLPYITICYINPRFLLPLELSRMSLLGCRLAALHLREAACWQSVILSYKRSKPKRENQYCTCNLQVHSL